MSELEIVRTMICSTKHATAEEAEEFDIGPSGASMSGAHGWLLWVGWEDGDVSSQPDNPSPGLAGAIAVARRNGCAYLLFDSDGPTLDGVPGYDW